MATRTTAPFRVYVVDDDQDLCMLIKLACGRIQGVEVRSVSRPSSALADISSRVPDLIIIDVMMPEMSGPQLLEQLRAAGIDGLNETKVVFLTAKTQKEEVEELRRLNVTDVWAKPFSPTRLMAEVERLMA